jgi:hypothetical protein
MWYVEHFAIRRNAVDRTFCDAITVDQLKITRRRGKKKYNLKNPDFGRGRQRSGAHQRRT